MGNSESTTFRLGNVLPPSHESGWYEKSGSELDRDQFIRAIITVMTNNGQLELQGYKFNLLYSRRENERVVARIVAERDGIIHAKIEPVADGKDQKEAFRALKRHVEMRLDDILQEVPSGTAAAKMIAGSSRVPAAGARSVPVDAPPAYGADVKTSSRKQ
ncbi:hypothetical protein LTR08_005251 [Meristemomyces frigidus]|nr:hypothetical protein LTR08_005251 [Meristemomyces frigidus]